MDLFAALGVLGSPMGWCLEAQVGRGHELTAGRTGAVDRGHPEVGGAGVEDHSELLRGGADADGAEVLHLSGRGGEAQFTEHTVRWDPTARRPCGLCLGWRLHPPSRISLHCSLSPSLPAQCIHSSRPSPVSPPPGSLPWLLPCYPLTVLF